MRKLVTMLERRKSLQAKRTKRNVRSQEKAKNRQRRRPLFIQAVKKAEKERALAVLKDKTS